MEASIRIVGLLHQNDHSIHAVHYDISAFPLVINVPEANNQQNIVTYTNTRNKALSLNDIITVNSASYPERDEK